MIHVIADADWINGHLEFGHYDLYLDSPEELEAFKKDPNYFVSIENNVYKNDKDYAFKRVMIKLKQGRAVYKYGGQKIDSELLTEIDRLIKEKSQK